MTEIRLPHITGRTPEEKLVQMERYLYQLAQQLNYVLGQLEKEET